MFPKRFRDPKTGFRLLSPMHAKKYLKNIGLEREDYHFLKRVGKGLLCTYAVLGALWLYNENSSLGWGKLKPQLKQHEEALKGFIAKGGMTGMMAESGKENFDEEAQKLWLRMKNEIKTELREKGFDVE